MPFETPENIASLALFLDVDGTLVPIAANPAAVVPSPDLPTLLAGAVQRLGGALALVSGREIESIDQLTAGLVPMLAGSHGAEFRFGLGQPIWRPEPRPDIAGFAPEVLKLAERWPAILIEPKRAGIAVHYRQAPELAGDLRAALVAALAGRSRPDLSLLQGDHVFEIRSPAHNKGEAVRRLMAEAPFKGRRPIFIGDDVTDEDGFAAAVELGGTAIIVGERRPTLATRKLGSHEDVLRLLSRLAN